VVELNSLGPSTAYFTGVESPVFYLEFEFIYIYMKQGDQTIQKLCLAGLIKKESLEVPPRNGAKFTVCQVGST
jgi:hypothetical protein